MAANGEGLNEDKGVLDTQFVDTHKGNLVNRQEHLAPTVGPDLKQQSHRKKFEFQ